MAEPKINPFNSENLKLCFQEIDGHMSEAQKNVNVYTHTKYKH